MTDRSSGIDGVAGAPFRSSADAHPTVPIRDDYPTVPLDDLHPTMRLDDLHEPAAESADAADRPAGQPTRRLDDVAADALAGDDRAAGSPFADVPPIPAPATDASAGLVAEGAAAAGESRPLDAERAGGWTGAAGGPLPPPATDSPYDPFAASAPAAPAEPAASPSPYARAASAPPPVPSGGGLVPWGQPAASAPGSPWAQPATGAPDYGQAPSYGQSKGHGQPPSYGQPPSGGPAPWTAGAPADEINQLGLWSLICAGIAVVGGMLPVIQWFAWFAPIAGVVLGIIGLASEQYAGRRQLAAWGLGANLVLLIVLPLIAFAVFVLGFAIIPLVLLPGTL